MELLQTVASGAVIAVLCAWTLATVSKLHDGADEHLAEWLGMGANFVPNWNFFSPHPGQYDYHMLYRDRTAEGDVTTWRELSELTDLPDRFYWIWNPNVYNAKAVFDFGQKLTKEIIPEDRHEAAYESDEESDSPPVDPGEVDDPEEYDAEDYLDSIEAESYKLTPQYVSLLHYVSAVDDRDRGAQTQFMLMRSSLRSDDYEPVFLSDFHELER